MDSGGKETGGGVEGAGGGRPVAPGRLDGGSVVPGGQAGRTQQPWAGR